MSNTIDIMIVGAACRLPGAPDEARFREVLNEGRFTVGALPAGRWYPDLLFHPNQRTRGAAYTFAGGYLDAPYDFDIGVFGMSPREAMQVDPQQRLLAEVVWEALEDARIPPTELAGSEVGVYVGVSALDHANLFGGDPGAIESFFMTGNTLSVVANRISYLFDLRGPSFVVDTACSSSLVAVDRAVADLRSGRVDTAIVGGVNMLLSPASFVGFSRASMLSPTGACRPFSASADGYVRSEGAVVFVLRRPEAAAPGSVRALIRGTAVNSDGRTSGIALPGLDGQRALLDRVYGETGIAPDAVAFVEAHGTGTVVGDPIEATAIGTVLGKGRSNPLPIGSVKSNIGHLEPASGVAGMMKALIALEQRRLPVSLHLDTLNPHVDFAALNLQPVREAVDLGEGVLHCGVSSFGFGGTNAHVVMGTPPPNSAKERAAPQADMLVLTAHCKAALAAMATSCAGQIDAGAEPGRVAAALNSGRSALRHRAVVDLTGGASVADSLRAFAEGGKSPAVITGNAMLDAPPKVCFIFNGNGAQWVGMGRAAYAANPTFARSFDAADAAFQALGMDSLVEMLAAEDLSERIQLAACAQPLIFAIQIGIHAALADLGLVPDSVLGHSVGEIAAAHVAGILDLDQSARILAARANCQEAVRGTGGMATFAANRSAIDKAIAESGIGNLCVAADNGPASVTVTGRKDSIAAFLKEVRRRRIAGRALDLDYPYHSPLLDGIKGSFLAEIGILSVSRPTLPMFSTVTGRQVEGTRLASTYWWDNIRKEVLFRQAVLGAAEHGARLFVEIGPRAILSSAVAGVIEEAGLVGRSIPSLSENDEEDSDPVRATFARAIANGFQPPNRTSQTRQGVDRSIPLPSYPWQRKSYRYEPTSAAMDIHGLLPRHPLIGARMAQGAPEWRTLLDKESVPYLADHVVGGEVVVPATALAEMALAVARELQPSGPVGIEDFDIVQAMVLSADGQREVSIRYGEMTASVEIFSRARFSADDWILCARGRIGSVDGAAGNGPALPLGKIVQDEPDRIYARASAIGLDYGPAFRLVEQVSRDNSQTLDITLRVAAPGTGVHARPQVLHPASLDAALHGLFDLLPPDDSIGRAWLPIRFGRLRVWQDQAPVVAATLVIEKSTEHLKTLSIWLRASDGSIIARLDGALLRAVVLSRKTEGVGLYHLRECPAGSAGERVGLLEAVRAQIVASGLADRSDGWRLLQAHMRSVAYSAFARLADDDGLLDIDRLVAARLLARESLPYFRRIVAELLSAGLVRTQAGKVMLLPDTHLPEADVILSTFAADYPQASADLALSAQAALQLEAALAHPSIAPPRAVMLDRSNATSLRIMPAATALADWIHTVARTAAGALHVVLAEAQSGPLLSMMAERAAAGHFRLSYAAMDTAAAERLTRRLDLSHGVEVIDLSRSPDPCADIVVVLCVTGQDSLTHASAEAYSGLLQPGGVLITAHCVIDNLAAFQRGPQASIEDGARGPEPLPGEILDGVESLADHAVANSDQAGFAVWTARRARASGQDRSLVSALCLAHPSPTAICLIARLTPILERESVACTLLGSDPLIPSESRAANLLYVVGELNCPDGLASVIDSLRRLLIGIRADDERPRCWIAILSGGLGGPAAVAGVRAFLRVAMNEMSDCDIRFVEIADDTGDEAIGTALARLMVKPGAEREFVLRGQGLYVHRILSGVPRGDELAVASTYRAGLQVPRPGTREKFQWSVSDEVKPGPGEIEIAIAATGLNFRDVMLAMGLLNDDVLDEGFAGAVYGLECAGTVVSVGEGVSRFRVGDRVVGFGVNCFATHNIAPQDRFIAIPTGLSAEVAAGIPVPFFTAWYSLVEMARLRPGERVLIHGGAGGVGLAAIQIANVIGAEVIVTVSSPDKEAVARLYGAAHVYDSRSLAFADQVETVHGGVDVVLNSLSGDAMRASIKCLRPRGRFVELGKRDYVANSQLGLRPFRRNLSYFGVDVDQILALDDEIAPRALREIMHHFQDGSYLPLPTMAFRSSETGDAFRQMQSAGHIGKIVVNPPRGGTAADGIAPAFKPGAGVQLIIGGTRGFGLETAFWLAGQGARRIVVASRFGVLDPAAQARVDALRETGVMFAVERVDVCNAGEVDALFARVAAAFGPVNGIYLTAATLDDGLIENLTEESIERVLAPKAKGAENLDRASRSQPVEQFVLYSSASALVGNPGQAAYAAANGYLEGLARRRRAEGLPALAVAWGAITDVGLLADRPETLDVMRRVAAVSGMQSAEALARLGPVLARADSLGDPVVVCSEFASDGALVSLPVASSPAFAALFRACGTSVVEGGVSLAEMLVGKSEAESYRLISALVAEEVAQILRLAVQDIDMDASVDSLGMDSLMALELRMSIESKYRVELPVMAITAVGNLRELAHRVLQTVQRGDSRQDDVVASDAERALLTLHGGDGQAITVTNSSDVHPNSGRSG